MKIDNFLQLFVVKEKKFFPLFINQAKTTVKAAALLLEQTQEIDHDKRISLSRRIKECERAGDEIYNKIIDELVDAFITPFDREDIHQLASMLDTFLDSIRDCAKKFAIYQPDSTDEKLSSIAAYILEDAKLVESCTLNFEGMRKKVDEVGDLCDRIKEVEHTVDDIYESYMMSIFEYEKNVVELVKKKNIVQALEDTTDCCKALSEVIRSIVVKIG